MRSDSSLLQMVDHHTGRLRLLACQGFSSETARIFEWVSADMGTSCAAALRRGQRVVVGDIETCDFMVGTPAYENLLESGIRAAQSTPLVDRDGRVIGMISTHWRVPHEPATRELLLLDVLARQTADLIDRGRVEQDLRDFVENANVAMHRVGPDGVILWANRTELEMLGFSRDEYVGHHIAEFHADRAVVDDILEKLGRAEKLPQLRGATSPAKTGRAVMS